jgi:hypothetical protein
MTGDTTGEGCEGEEEEDPQKYLMTPFVGFTRSGGVESAVWSRPRGDDDAGRRGHQMDD